MFEYDHQIKWLVSKSCSLNHLDQGGRQLRWFVEVVVVEDPKLVADVAMVEAENSAVGLESYFVF